MIWWMKYQVACAIVFAAIAPCPATAQVPCESDVPLAATSARPYRSDRLIVLVAPTHVATESTVDALRNAEDDAIEPGARRSALEHELGGGSLTPLFVSRPTPGVRPSAASRPSDLSTGDLSAIANSAQNTFFLLELEPGQDLEEVLGRARAHPDVVSAQPDFIYTPDLTPNDRCFSEQYSHSLTRATQAWDLETGDPDIVIAFVGSGVDRTHPDLMPNMWENTDEFPDSGFDDDENGFIDDRYGWDFLDKDSDPMPDDDPHETKVSGVAAAVGNNSQGVAGVAWNVRIMSLRVGFTSSTVSQAIAYAHANGARVINMSFGNYEVARYGPDTVVEAVVESAFASGIVLVATAGNDTIKIPRFPAALSDVMAVAATNEDDERASFSNWGSFVSVAAPGRDILTTSFEISTEASGGMHHYENVSGTSFAAPYVSGLAALLLSQEPNLTPTEVRRRIEYGSDALTTDRLIGAGRVNAFRTLTLDADPTLFALIKSPLDGEIMVDLDVVGTAIGDAYQLDYRLPGDAAWIPLSSGIETYDGVLGSFDGISLSSGAYELRLTSTYGGESASHELSFTRANLLPGWPNAMQSAVYAGPSYADIDGDGDLEVFATDLSGAVHGWHHDGVPLLNWPVSGNVYSYGSPAIGDIDGDGEPEVLQASYAGGVYAWHADGTEVEGWPQFEDDAVRGSVALADLAGDGAYEAIVAGLSGVVHAFKGDGSDLPGWPVQVAEANVQSTPAIGDLDGDGTLEVVVKQSSKVYAWHRNGVAVTGWPVDVGVSHTAPILLDVDADGSDEVVVIGGGARIFDGDGTMLAAAEPAGVDSGTISAGDVDGDGSPEICVGSLYVTLLDLNLNVLSGWPVSVGSPVDCVIGDVDGDGFQEVVGVTQDGRIFAWNGDGTIAPGEWPLYVGSPIRQAPALGDLDGDGSLDLMVGSGAGELHVFELGFPYAPNSLAWPMVHGSETHDGRVHFVPEPSATALGIAAVLTLAWLRRPRAPARQRSS